MGENPDEVPPSGEDVALRILIGKYLKNAFGSCPTCSQMARLSTYKAMDGFDEELRRGEDTDLNIRLASKGAHFVGIKNPLVEQTMTKTSEKSLKDEYYYWRIIYAKHREIINKEGSYTFCLSWLSIKQSWLEGHKLLFLIKLVWTCLRFPISSIKKISHGI